MISPLGPNWSVYLGFHEQIRLNNCPEDFKPVYFRGHVDDIFACFVHLIILENGNLFKFET